MTVTVLRYDPDTGAVRELMHVADHDYEPNEDELLIDDPAFHRGPALEGMKVDTSADPPALVEDPDHRTAKEVRRDVDEHLEAMPDNAPKRAIEDLLEYVDRKLE